VGVQKSVVSRRLAAISCDPESILVLRRRAKVDDFTFLLVEFFVAGCGSGVKTLPFPAWPGYVAKLWLPDYRNYGAMIEPVFLATERSLMTKKLSDMLCRKPSFFTLNVLIACRRQPQKQGFFTITRGCDLREKAGFLQSRPDPFLALLYRTKPNRTSRPFSTKIHTRGIVFV